MNKDGGFVKIYRSMLQWEWHDDPITMATWVYCLMRANYETQRWHGQIIKPGQFVTSLSHMAKDIGISMQNLRTALNHLKSTHELTSKVTKSATLITIEKWAVYQSAGEKVTSHLTHELTNDQQTPNKELTTIEEREERKEREEREINREMDGTRFKQVDRETLHFKDGDVEIIRGVPQLTEEESNEILRRSHEQFAPIKARIAAEAMQRIKEREAKQ